MPTDREAPTYPVPAEFDDDRFHWLFDYWLQRRENGRLPGRRDIDPLHFRHLLGRVYLIEVVRESERIRFRFRLWGSKISGIFGQEHTGHWLEDIAAPGTLAELENTLRTCTLGARPHFWRRPMMVENVDYVATRRMLLPLASDGQTVDMLFGLIIEEPAPANSAR
ncbi:hypothetical protein BAL199_25937 [alpha proteobacterium BAL199]|nr:hypothetical protein BAL199_25937 [alpha proteobacterium BAL199]